MPAEDDPSPARVDRRCADEIWDRVRDLYELAGEVTNDPRPPATILLPGGREVRCGTA